MLPFILSLLWGGLTIWLPLIVVVSIGIYVFNRYVYKEQNFIDPKTFILKVVKTSVMLWVLAVVIVVVCFGVRSFPLFNINLR